jgi:hypothetical protein
MVIMRTFKNILRCVFIVFLVVFVNGCIYVFGLQDKTMKKIQDGAHVSLYEKCSIYTMHMAVYLFGWPLSPEAAGEIYRMSFPWNREKTVFKRNDFFIDSPTVEHALKKLTPGQRKYIAFKASAAYNTASPDHRVALAVNPGYLYKKDGKIYLESYAHYPQYSKTPITLFGAKIIIHEGLFHYLEKIGWLHPYTMTWWCKE